MLTVGIHGVPDRKDPSGKSIFISHDHGVAFSRGNRIVAAVELERYTGIKHDNRIEEYIIEILLKIWDRKEKLRFVLVNSFLGSSFSSCDGALRIDWAVFEMQQIFTETTGRFCFQGNCIDCEYFIFSHEFAHIASVLPFFQGFDRTSILVHLDGGASMSCRSVWKFDGREISLLDYGWDITKVAVNNFNDNTLAAWVLGVSLDEHLSIPGKLMGLAAWGRWNEALFYWLMENKWFMKYTGSKEDFLSLVPDTLGYSDPQLGTENQFSQDLALCMQRYFENTIVSYITHWVEQEKAEAVYYSGGAALNILTNTKLEKVLEGVPLMIPPAASDSGLALGAAAFFAWKDYGELENCSPFLNTIYPDVRNCDVSSKRTDLTKALAEGKIIGVIAGDSEIGPRALGHRSFLARPDSVTLRRKLSEGVKQREWYRPVAPVLLEENALKFFKNYQTGSSLGRYMLGCWEIQPEYVDLFKGVIHADNTVRAQIITSESPGLGYLVLLLKELWEKHGIGGLINTSLNVKGRPILHSLEKKLCHELSRMGVDSLYFLKEEIGA